MTIVHFAQGNIFYKLRNYVRNNPPTVKLRLLNVQKNSRYTLLLTVTSVETKSFFGTNYGKKLPGFLAVTPITFMRCALTPSFFP